MRVENRNDPAQLRHQMELSNWWLDLDVPPDAFASSSTTSAKRIMFARPDPKLPPGLKPPTKSKPPVKSKPAKTQ